MHNQDQVLFGTRIPAQLKEMLIAYCSSNGIKINYFITEAIKERLLEVAEDKYDVAVTKERLKDSDFMSRKKFKKYLLKRGIRF